MRTYRHTLCHKGKSKQKERGPRERPRKRKHAEMGGGILFSQIYRTSRVWALFSNDSFSERRLFLIPIERLKTFPSMLARITLFMYFVAMPYDLEGTYSMTGKSSASLDFSNAQLVKGQATAKCCLPLGAKNRT